MGCLDQNPPPFSNQQEYNVWLYEQLVNLDGCVPDTPDEPDCKEETLSVIDPNDHFPPVGGEISFYASGFLQLGLEWEDVFEVGDTIWIDGEGYEIEALYKGIENGQEFLNIKLDRDVEVDSKAKDELVVSNCEPDPEAAPQMVFYGVKPPDETPVGAIFTDENSIKSFVHQGEGVWIEHTPCVGDGDGGEEERPWVRIDDWRVVREYFGSSVSQSPDGFVSKILLWDVPCNEIYPYTLTQEWEWDELGDDNWVPLDMTPNDKIHTLNYEDNWYWRYRYTPEDFDGNGMDPNFPDPCAKVRCRVKNEWDNGEFEYSNWAEFWIGRAATPLYDHPHQPPTVC